MPRNQTFCPISDETLGEVLCAVDEACVCANSSHIRELANVTVDGLACYACEPRRPPACTEANDQCTPEACECGNPLTHVKRDATTVDGSPCHYCEPIGGMASIGRPEFFMVLMVLALIAMWQLLGRKPVSGKSSLRLSRRQGDRNRAIRVQQEPLRFYEEVMFMVGDFFDFVVDGAWELFRVAWGLLQRLAAFLSSASPLKTVNAIRSFIRPAKDDLDWDVVCTQREAKRPLRRRLEAPTADSAAGSATAGLAPVRPSAQKAPVPRPEKAPERKLSNTSTASKATEQQEKANEKARRPGPKAKLCPPKVLEERGPGQDGPAELGKEATASLKVDSQEAQEVAETCTSCAQTGLQSDLPKDVHFELPSPSPLYKAAIAVIKASAVEAAVEVEGKSFMQSTTTVMLEEFEGSTEGSIAPNDDDTAQTESEDCDNRGSLRANTAAAAAAILAAATDKRAAALELLDAAAMPTIEVRTFLSEPDMEAPVMRRTVSDSDLALYC
ncbi:hypothetical protein AK812_SmicGene1879 [Symbiodinium microadriaticum]|uniref:Uncharacterized protein n=1 Tax=Symbiodinium microadriaticum TaxID=2951 RepID=A0A1Q9F2X6_SYMMI|nr:hypothetical protein AK812_SmicGene1879 [Symbiodinium microadriaticum]